MEVIKIRQTGLPAPRDAHWNYGADYMRRISRKTAVALCRLYPLPDIGRAITIAVAPGQYGFRHRLTVQNVGGNFYIASVNTPVSQWPEVFRVQITG